MRNRYNLQTSQLDEQFEKALAYKSGCPEELVRDIVSGIQNVEESYEISDEELMAFNEKIDNFINKP